MNPRTIDYAGLERATNVRRDDTRSDHRAHCVAGGADANALEHDRYDIVTIAAVADDVPTSRAATDDELEIPFVLNPARVDGVVVDGAGRGLEGSRTSSCSKVRTVS